MNNLRVQSSREGTLIVGHIIIVQHKVVQTRGVINLGHPP